MSCANVSVRVGLNDLLDEWCKWFRKIVGKLGVLGKEDFLDAREPGEGDKQEGNRVITDVVVSMESKLWKRRASEYAIAQKDNLLGSLFGDLAGVSLATYDKRINVTSKLLSGSEGGESGGSKVAIFVLEEDERVCEVDTRSSKASTQRQGASSVGSATQGDTGKHGGCKHCEGIGKVDGDDNVKRCQAAIAKGEVQQQLCRITSDAL